MSYRCPVDVRDPEAPNGVRKCKNHYDPASGAKDCGVHTPANGSVQDAAIYSTPLQDCSGPATLEMDDLVAAPASKQSVTLDPDFLRGAREVALGDHEHTRRILDDAFDELARQRGSNYAIAGGIFDDLSRQTQDHEGKEFVRQAANRFEERRIADVEDANAVARAAASGLNLGAQGEIDILRMVEDRMNSLNVDGLVAGSSGTPEELACQVDNECKTLLTDVDNRMWDLQHEADRAKDRFADRASQVLQTMDHDKSYDFQSLQGALGYYADVSSVIYLHNNRRSSFDEAYQRSWRLFQEAEVRRGQIAREITTQVTRRRSELLDSMGIGQFI